MKNEYAYIKTHKWLTFKLRLDAASSRFWILAGEAKSKCEHMANVPLKPATAKTLHRVFLVKGVRATVAIEGNTLSEDQVRERLEGKQNLLQSQEYLGTEVDNILVAINKIGDQAENGNPPELSVSLIKEFNRLILQGLEHGEDVTPGEIRKAPFGVGHYRGAPADECEYLLEQLCEWLNGPDFDIPDDENRIVTAIIKSIVAHVYIEWIHPFGDGNGRTGRLVEYLLLVNSGLPRPAAHLLSNHYNSTRSEYYKQLDQSSKSGGDLIPFLTYALQGFVDGLKDQLKFVRFQQWSISWESFVHEMFQDKTSPSEIRRRRLVLDLSRSMEPVPLEKIPQMTPRLAAAYATKNPRTVIRDLIKLTEMGLVEFSPTGYRAMKEKILAFLPFAHVPIQKKPEE